MTAETTHVKVVLTADARPYERALAGAARAASSVDRSMASVAATTDEAVESADAVTESVQELGEESAKASLAATALGTAISFIGARALGSLQQAIGAASDFNETVSKMKTVFGTGAAEVERFFANSAKDFGLSKQAAYDAATSVASMGKAAGLTGTELAKFANQTVALSADLASFYNAAGGAEEVIYALTSAMRGEYESARRFNILLDDMTLRQRALAMGMIETTKMALTPQQRALAAQAEILAQTSDAQGDFARTSDGLANSQRTLSAQMEDARVELGQNLLPIMLAGVQVLSTLVDGFNGLSDPMQRLIAYLAATAAAIALLGPPIRGALALLATLRGAAVVTAVANIGLAASFRAVGYSALWAAAGIAKMLGPIMLLVAGALALDAAMDKLDKGDTWWGKLLGLPTEGTPDALGPIKRALGFGDDDSATDKDAVDAEKAALDGLKTSMDAAAAASDALGDAQAGMAAEITAAEQAILDQMAVISSHIDTMQALASTGDTVLGMQDRLRGSAKQTSAATSAMSKAERDEQQKTIDGIRKRENAEQEAEIKRARRAAQRKADRRADREAREEGQAGVAKAIATDKAARAGKDIDGFNQGGAVGERTGRLTDAEEKALDKKIEGIRKRHQKSTEAQIKALKGAEGAATGAGKATEYYNTTLDRNTEAGRRNRAAFSGELDSIQARATAVYDAAIAEGKTVAEAATLAQDEFTKLIGKLEDAGVEAGYTREAVKKLLLEFGLTPEVITTKWEITVDDKELDDAVRKWGTPGKGKVWSPTLGAYIQGESSATTSAERELGTAKGGKGQQKIWDPVRGAYVVYVSGKAAGGEVYGPGGPRADKVPIWASAGEYIVNASQYAANRDLVRAINAGNGRVSGGMTIGSVNVTESSASRVRASVIDALAESAYRSGVVR